MKKIIIHILDRKIIYVLNNKLNIIDIDLSVGKIVNEDQFLKTIQKYNRQNKINQKIIGDEVIIILNNFYTPQDIKYIKQLFLELQFSKVTTIKESELLIDKEFIYTFIDQDLTKIIIPTFEPIYISTSLINNQLFNKIVQSYPENLPTKIIDYTNTSQLKPSNKHNIYVLTHPYNFFIDKIMQV